MPKFDPLRFIADHAGMALADAISEAYRQGQQDAQPIRCVHCKHYKITDKMAFGYPVKQCVWNGFEDVDDDDFCSFAVRKEGEADDK